jgi:hypothetical protein
MKLFLLLIPFLCIHVLPDYSVSVKKTVPEKKQEQLIQFQFLPSNLLFQFQ